MKRTRICLVRHGETDWNVEKRLQGHEDVPLNPTGRAQARAMAMCLGDEDFSAIYSSDLSRALTTAKVASKSLGLVVQTSEDLRERNFGAYQGLTHDEAREIHGEDYDRFRGRDVDYAVPGGESLRQVAERVQAELERLAQAHEGETILVVSHGGVLDIAHRMAAGKPLEAPRDFTISNAALNWIEYGAGSWRLVTWDEKRHLEDARDELPG